MAKPNYNVSPLWSTASDPGSPVAADMWYRSDTGRIRYRNGSASRDLGILGDGYTLPRITSGRWYKASPCATVAAGAYSVNYCHFVPFWPNYTGTLNGIAYELTTQAAGTGTDDLRFGLYADNGGGLPTGTALFDSGLLDNKVAPGVKTVSVSWTGITPTLYWLASLHYVTGSITTPSQHRQGSGGQETRARIIADASATPAMGGSMTSCYIHAFASGALPTFSSYGVATDGVPIVLVKFA